MTISLYKYKYEMPPVSEEYVDYDYLQELETVGLVDDFISCIFTRSWTGIGEWEIVMPKDSPHIQEFYEAQFIRIHHQASGIINKTRIDVNEEQQTITFTGCELKGLFTYRAVQGIGESEYIVSDTLYDIKYDLFLTNIRGVDTHGNPTWARWIPSLCISDPRYTSGPTIKFSRPTGNLGSIYQSLSETYDNGWTSRIALTATGHTERTKNLLIRYDEDYDKHTLYNVLTGSYINSSGKATSSPGDAYTKYIPVEPGQEYYWYGVNSTAKTGNKRLHGYSAENENSWVQQLGLASNVAAGAPYEIHITIPNGVNFIRCSFIEADTDVMLELAPKTSYQPPWITHTRDYEMIGHIISMAPIDCTKDQELEGLDKGMPLILSYNLDTLYSSSLEVSKHQPNVAYVLGNGIGSDRELAIVDEDNSIGINRCEVIVDARDVSQTSYLYSRGQEYLAKYGSSFSYTFEASPYIISRYPWAPNNNYLYQSSHGVVIPEDKNVELGYYGTIVDDELGIEQDFEITAIREVYQADGFHLELELGYDNQNIRGNFNLVSAQTQSLINSSPVIATDAAGYSTINYGLTIAKGTAPYIHLNSGSNATTAGFLEASQTGNYVSLGAKDTANSATSRSILLYNPNGAANIRDALILQNITANGSSTETTNYIVVHSGNIGGFRWGKIYVKDLNGTGNFVTTGSISGASLFATGSVTGDNATFTNGVSCKTLTATNDISGLNVTASNKVDCYDIDVTNKVSTKTVHVEDGYYPMFELKPTANSVTKVQRVEGSLYGNVSLQAWADAAGNNRSLLVIHDPVAQTNIANVLQLRQCKNGTWSDYPIFHKGNATFPHQVVWTNSASDWNTITGLYGGSWSSVGSIKVGSKTLYAYERTS